jgi:hypothetical protein
MCSDGNGVPMDAYLKVFEHDWVDQDSPADTNRPAGDTKSISLCSHSAREDFCGDQESDCAPSGRIDEVEEEEHEYGGGGNAGCLGRVVTGSFV